MAFYKWAIFRHAAFQYCRLHWIMQEVQDLGPPISINLRTNIEYNSFHLLRA